MVRRLTVLTLLLLCGRASAADVCGDDVKAFCSDVKPGGGRVNKCLLQHQSQVTPACRAKLETDPNRAKELIAEFSDACYSDMQRLCAGVQPGKYRMIKCLTRNDYVLSPRCTAEVAKIETARQKMSQLETACRPEAQRLCASSMSDAGDLLSCLEENQAELSPACKAEDPKIASESAALVDTLNTMTSEARIEDTVAILQGLNSVAFSRNQIAMYFDYLQSPAAKPANLDQITFNPLLVFGPQNQFAVALKVPVAAVFPDAVHPPAVQPPAGSGVADINTGFGWAFYARGAVRQYAALSLQWNSASAAAVGAPWVVSPVYAIAAGLAGWVSLTTELSWSKSLGNVGSYPGINLLVVRPILVFNLPSTIFLSVDTKLGWDFIKQVFVPVMRFQGGKLIGRDLSISAWYQVTLNTVGRQDAFNFGVGFNFSYFFDW